MQISDQGVDIGPERLNKIFQPHYVRDPKRSSHGIRMGLWFTKKILQIHGGTVSAFSAGPGRGSIFTIRLPEQNGKP